MERNKFETEWCFLQEQFESYEKHSLYIKLVSILVLCFFLALGAANVYLVVILGVLWLQDAIWKTFQSRLEPRLLTLEQKIRENAQEYAFQFNTEYQNASKSGLSLIFEYLSQAIRPTIAFPHVVLIGILLAKLFLG